MKQYIITLTLAAEPDGLQQDEICNRVADSVRWLGFVDTVDIEEVPPTFGATSPDATGHSS